MLFYWSYYRRQWVRCDNYGTTDLAWMLTYGWARHDGDWDAPQVNTYYRIVCPD